MKKISILLLAVFSLFACSNAYSQSSDLRIVIIRHGEKDATGDNLNCRGLNRALQIPKVITAKFGVPSMIYVPAVDAKKSTSHARMFETAAPLAIKHNLTINTKYSVDDYADLAQNLEKRSGTVLVVWEHKALDNLLRELGIKTNGLKWGDNDFDSIWVVTYKDGKPKLAMDKEGINPQNNCSF